MPMMDIATLATEPDLEESVPSVRIAVACVFCTKSTISLGKNDKANKLRRPPAPGILATSPSSSLTLPVSPSATTKSALILPDKCVCQKPRLRCTLCLSRLNTQSTLQMFQPSYKIEKTSDGGQVAKPVAHPFAAFTVFCVTCRHSGHAIHYLNWFKNNSTCPVSGCTCPCSSLDSKNKDGSPKHVV